MVSKLTPDDGNRKTTLSVIRTRLPGLTDARLSPQEAGLVLDWAASCSDPALQAGLMEIFDMADGITQFRKLAGPAH